jgi:hypothetical protein
MWPFIPPFEAAGHATLKVRVASESSRRLALPSVLGGVVTVAGGQERGPNHDGAVAIGGRQLTVPSPNWAIPQAPGMAPSLHRPRSVGQIQ